MNLELTTLKSLFASIQIELSDIWLESCVNWCKSEVLEANYTSKDLQSKVYEQWLLFDLRDVQVRSLPPNLSSQKHFTLTGNFCLQLMQVIDISKPKLWQLQKIRNNHVLTRGTQLEADVVGTGRRMLQLTLTDGVQEVEAMEYRPIPSLNINLTPGLKIRIMGPVVVRRGRLMLEQQNIKILGGEVEELQVSNHPENVLARSLKLPENPNPVTIEEKLFAVEKEEVEVPRSRVIINRPPPPTSSRNKPQPYNRPAISFPMSEEDEMMVSREIDMLLEAEEDVNRHEYRKRKSSDYMFEDLDFNDEDFDRIDSIATSTQINTSRPHQQKKIILQNLDDDDDVFKDIDIDAHLDAMEKEAEFVRVTPEMPRIVTIAKLLENKKNISSGTFKINAKFKSVVEKLTITENEYKLVIKIEDYTSDLIVKIHNDIIADFAGSDAYTIVSLKQDILENDESAVERVLEAMQQVKDKLLKLDNIMVIQITKEEIPVIVKLL